MPPDHWPLHLFGLVKHYLQQVPAFRQQAIRERLLGRSDLPGIVLRADPHLEHDRHPDLQPSPFFYELAAGLAQKLVLYEAGCLSLSSFSDFLFAELCRDFGKCGCFTPLAEVRVTLPFCLHPFGQHNRSHGANLMGRRERRGHDCRGRLERGTDWGRGCLFSRQA